MLLLCRHHSAPDLRFPSLHVAQKQERVVNIYVHKFYTRTHEFLSSKDEGSQEEPHGNGINLIW